jgi:hypothetical protein
MLRVHRHPDKTRLERGPREQPAHEFGINYGSVAEAAEILRAEPFTIVAGNAPNRRAATVHVSRSDPLVIRRSSGISAASCRSTAALSAW